MSLTVGTLNILDPVFAEKHFEQAGLTNGKSNWNTRHVQLANLLENSNLDIICLQELSKQSFADLSRQMVSRNYVFLNESHSSRHDGLGILYNTKKFHHIDSKIYTIHGMTSYVIEIAERSTGKIIRIANCHLLGGPNTPKGSQQITDLVQRFNRTHHEEILANIVVGDFNADEKQEAANHVKFQPLKSTGYQFDGDISATEPAKGRHIDWIWAHSSHQKMVMENLVVAQPVVSDHILKATKIVFPPKAAVEEVIPPTTNTSNPEKKPEELENKQGFFESLLSAFTGFFNTLWKTLFGS